MKKSLVKDFFREIWKTKSRFLSILAIVALGAGFFAGINVTTTDMKLTAANYYRNYNLMDFHLVSTYGITDDDIEALEQQRDELQVETIMPGYSKDVMANPGTKQETTVKILSYGGEKQTLNQYKLLEGRMPEKPNECVVDATTKAPDNFAIGETITVATGSVDDDIKDTLSIDTFEVVGIVQSPLYVNFSRGYTTIGNGTLTAFLVVPEEAFVLDVYTDVYLTTKGAFALDPFTDAYPDLIAEQTAPLEAFAEKRGKIRYDDIVREAQKALDDGKKELADGEKEAARELQKARKQLDDAKQQLTDGKTELATQKDTFLQEKANGLRQLQDAQVQLDNGQAELNQKEAEYKQAKAQYDAEYPAAIEKIQAGEQQLAAEKEKAAQQFAAAKQQLETAKSQLDEAKTQLEQGQTELNNSKQQLDASQAALTQKKAELETAKDQMPPEMYAAAMQEIEANQGALASAYQEWNAQQAVLQQKQAEYQAGLAQYNENYQQYQAGRAQADAQISAAQTELDNARAALSSAKAQLDAGADTLAQGQAELSAARTELTTQWQNYDAQIADAEQQITDAEQQLADAEQEIVDGEKEYAEGKAESDKKLADARAEIAENEEKLNDLEKPEWYVWTRDDNVGYPDYGNDADRIKNVSTVLPIFFILIAVLVCLTTMTRMVEERRTQIGTLKALGYGKGPIMAKYVLYAAAATIIGCAIGLSVGFVLFPAVLFLAYSTAYNIPDHLMPFHWEMAGICTAVAIVCMIAATLLACYKELYAEPATLMRPKAPPAGKKILLERWTSLWKKIPFAMKLTLRNLLRYKKRAVMTIVGIAGCTALMLTGFGLQYAIQSIVDKQFDTIMIYDGVISMKDNISEKDKQTAFADVQKIDGITSQMFIKMSNIDAEKDGHSLDAILMVPSDVQEFKNYTDLHTRTEKTPIPLTDDGVIVSEKLARVCGISKNDTMEITLDNKTITATVLNINENYAGNYVFMSPNLYAEAFGKLTYNCILINTLGDDYQNSISTELTKNELLMGSSFNKDTADNFRDIIQNLNSVVIVIIVSAGALAFIVLYNLVNINVGERIRELATLKVLGFRDHETSAYIYRENIICTIIGILIGLVGGIFLERFVIRTAEVDSAMFSPEIPFYCFLFAGLLTLAFTLVVNVTLHFKLKKLDMVESLKSIE